MQPAIVIVWALLAMCVAEIGFMTGNNAIMGIGALMVGFTCAFAC